MVWMALGLQSRNQRSSPRVDALLRVKGELVPVDFPIRILNLNRTGFAVLSEVRFRVGQRLVFRLSGIDGPSVLVPAAAVHVEPRRGAPGLFMTGFKFQPQHPGAVVPEADILELLTAIAPPGFKI